MPNQIARYVGGIDSRRVSQAGDYLRQANQYWALRRETFEAKRRADRETRLWELRNKPSASDSKMVTRQGEFVAGATNVVQRSYKRLKYGKKLSRSKLSYKLIKASQADCIQRYGRIGAYEGFAPSFNALFDGPGSLPICHSSLNLGEQGSYMILPVHVFDLTSLRYENADTGVTLGAPCQYVLTKYSSGGAAGPVGAYSWLSLNGQDRNAVAAAPDSHWNTERIKGSDAVDHLPDMPGKCFLSWADIKLALFGAPKQTTRFTVSFIQFNDRSYVPGVSRNLTTPVGDMRSPSEQENYDSFWDNFCKPLVFHPMGNAGSTGIQVFKTLMKKTYVIGPDTSTNDNPGQPNVLINLFKRFNRMCNYNWDDVAGNKTEAQLDSANFQLRTAGQNRPVVHPRARVYLMVTAQSYTPVSSVNWNTGVTPTFDCLIRKKIIYDNQ